MAIVKVLAPLTLQLLWCMFLVGMELRLRGRGRVVVARYILVRIAPLAAGILFLVTKVDDPMGVTRRKLRALYLLGVGLSAASSVLAIVALAFELYCVDAYWPWVVLASVPVASVHLVSVWFAVTGH
uniref:Uncharacterized protein n=1 Tax=Hordeum vulgare subsp. vulgare TaxID=112509 RepID=A0A8I7BG14_HORVV